VAAAGVLGGLLLVPAAVVGNTGLAFLPVAASGLTGTPMPGAGDVLRALAGRGGSSEEFGATGRMPEADTLSPDLLAALTAPSGPLTDAGPLATIPPGPLGIPGVVLDAYDRAERRVATTNPRCGVSWSLLAAIGRIESGHARGGRVDANGTTVSPILGPQLSGGPGVAAIRDSDGGRLDGDTTWDRAVGPMQFIPTTWARYAIDGNDDGLADPHNIYDAALAAAHYLCAGGEDLRDPAALASAVFRYNHSDSYVRTVLEWAAAYASGVSRIDGIVGPPPPATTTPPPPVTTTPPPPTTSPTPPTTTTQPPTSSTSSSSTSRPTVPVTTITTQPPTTTTTTTPPPTTTSAGSSTTCAPPTTTTTTAPTTTTTAPPGCEGEDTQAPPSEATSSMPSA
jgi:Transglycosylase SLT domain